jgi:hypothetical protein
MTRCDVSTRNPTAFQGSYCLCCAVWACQFAGRTRPNVAAFVTMDAYAPGGLACFEGMAFWSLMAQQNSPDQKRGDNCISVGKPREATGTSR